MPKYYGLNDTVLGERLYLVYEKPQGKPIRAGTKGKDNAIHHTIKGNPATATIKKPLRWKSP